MYVAKIQKHVNSIDSLNPLVFAFLLTTNLLLIGNALGQQIGASSQATGQVEGDSLAVFPEEQPQYQVFLLGNTGNGHDESALVVQNMLQAHLVEADANSAVVFLGDNIPCCAFPDSADVAGSDAAASMMAWLNPLRDYPGDIVIIPGNTESGSTAERRNTLEHKAGFIETYLGRDDVFLLKEGFPGPIAVELKKDITLIALNTQWWFDSNQRYGDTGEYRLNEPLDFLTEFEDVLYKYRNDRVLLAGHHPLFSNGNHGGRFSLLQHPYGAFIIPYLADAAGIYHTNPKLIAVPPDPRGIVDNEALIGQVVLLEERADEDVSNIDSFGNARNVIGSAKLFQEIDGDNDHRIDAYAFARARLFDMLIADHDRTLDNFRWAAFEP